ncbi:MAG TPA: TolC family protein [Mucilaginibacter sp.]
MKKIPLLILLIAFFLNHSAIAQDSMIGDVNYPLLEKYIQSAKENYPRVKVFQQREQSAKAAIPNNAVSYLDIFNASYIYRPNDAIAIASPGLTANPYSVNGFQFGVNFSLGQFLEKPFIGKKARADYNASLYETKEYLSTLELEVKKRYYAYIQQISLLKMLTQSVEDNRIVAENLKNKFEKGDVSLDVFAQSRANLTAANTTKLQCEANLLLAKDALEEIIGKKLSEIK